MTDLLTDGLRHRLGHLDPGDIDVRQELIDYYIDLHDSGANTKIDRQRFLQVFDWMSIQRNLKAIGTFAFQSVTKKNDRYLEYVPRTLAYVRETLSNRPELENLAKY